MIDSQPFDIDLLRGFVHKLLKEAKKIMNNKVRWIENLFQLTILFKLIDVFHTLIKLNAVENMYNIL